MGILLVIISQRHLSKANRIIGENVKRHNVETRQMRLLRTEPRTSDVLQGTQQERLLLFRQSLDFPFLTGARMLTSECLK